jgi:hypothetical protein
MKFSKYSRHKPSNIVVYHFVSGIAKCITYIIGKVKYFSSLLNQINVNRSILRTEYINLTFLINSLFEQLLTIKFLELSLFGLIDLKVFIKDKDKEGQSAIIAKVGYNILNLGLQQFFLLKYFLRLLLNGQRLNRTVHEHLMKIDHIINDLVYVFANSNHQLLVLDYFQELKLLVFGFVF